MLHIPPTHMAALLVPPSSLLLAPHTNQLIPTTRSPPFSLAHVLTRFGWVLFDGVPPSLELLPRSGKRGRAQQIVCANLIN